MSMDFFFDGLEGSGRNRRLHRRIDVDIKVRFRKMGADPQREPDFDDHIGFLRNISMGGAEIETRSVLPIRTLLLFEIDTPDRRGLTFTGVVQWVEEQELAVPDARSADPGTTPSGKTVVPRKKFSRIGIEFTTMSDKFRTYFNEIVGRHIQLDPEDPFFDSLAVSFVNPEDLYWEYHVNISRGRLYTTTGQRFLPGKVIKIQIKLQPQLEIIRVEGEVLASGRTVVNRDQPWWLVVKLLSVHEDDREKLFDYIRTVNRVIGDQVEAADAPATPAEKKDKKAPERFFLDPQHLKLNRAFQVFNAAGDPIIYVDLPSFQLVHKLHFFTNRTKKHLLFFVRRDQAISLAQGEYTLFLREDRPLAKIRAELSQQRVQALDIDDQPLWRLEAASSTDKEEAKLPRGSFLFRNDQEIMGSFQPEKQGLYSLNLLAAHEYTLDRRIALGAAVVLLARLR